MFNLLVILIFLRPFISSLAFPYLNTIYSVLFLAFLVILLAAKKLKLGNIIPKQIELPFALFIIAISISTIVSFDKSLSLRKLLDYTNALLLFLIVLSLSNNDKNRLLQCMVVSCLTVSILAIYQYLFGFQHLLAYLKDSNEIISYFTLDYILQKRIFFPFVTPNILAEYLAMMLPIVLIIKFRSIIIIPILVALILTKSLGALIAIFLVLAIYFYFKGELKKEVVIFTIGLLLITMAIFLTRALAQKHIQPIFSISMRLTYWKQTLELIKSFPIVGVGLGNFDIPPSRYAHNSYLQLWAETGILGISSFLWLIFSGFRQAIQNLQISTTQKTQTIALISAMSVFLIHNIISFSFFLPEVNVIWWVIFSLSISPQPLNKN